MTSLQRMWALAGLTALLPVGAVAGLHGWRGTPPSPPHAYILKRPLVAIVGGRAEDCLPLAWAEEEPDRVVNLARRGTDWRSVAAQIDFAMSVAPPGVLVVAADPEQLLHERDALPDPDRLRRGRFAWGGVPARVYGAFDRWLSLPRLFEDGRHPSADPARWGARMGEHWADPDGVRALRRRVRDARKAGVEVHVVALPLPLEAREAWQDAARGDQLQRILIELDALDLTDMPDGYFPDGLTCSRVTGRAVLDRLAR